MFGQGNMRKYLVGWALFAGLMLVLPAVVTTGTLRIIIFANYLAIFAMSWDILSGRTGYISFGHPFLIGIAGYTTAMLTYHLDTPLYLSIPLAVLATMVGGTLFFLPALRIRGTYFALVTLAFMELMYQLTPVLRPDITGGTRGLSGIPTLMTGAVPNYYISSSVMFVIGISLWLLIKTRLGTALSAIRPALSRQPDERGPRRPRVGLSLPAGRRAPGRAHRIDRRLQRRDETQTLR